MAARRSLRLELQRPVSQQLEPAVLARARPDRAARRQEPASPCQRRHSAVRAVRPQASCCLSGRASLTSRSLGVPRPRRMCVPWMSSKTALTTRVLQLVHEVLGRRIHITKRDLFYTDVRLFQDQRESDPILDDVACMLGCTRSSLNGARLPPPPRAGPRSRCACTDTDPIYSPPPPRDGAPPQSWQARRASWSGA